MEPLVFVLIPGMLGGVVLSLLLAGHRPRVPVIVVPKRLEAPTPTLINMAHIQVEGVGGLGMVAAVTAVAITDPRIRAAIILASILGVGLAILLIALRRHDGALPSSGDDPGARSILGLGAADPAWLYRAGRSIVRRLATGLTRPSVTVP
jgi:hypothetical protein